MLSIKKLQNSNNIAELLEESQLTKIAQDIIDGFEIDKRSRIEWEESIEEGLKLAKQVYEQKDFPWEKASSIKYPLIASAAIGYSSKTAPEILNKNQLMKPDIIGYDPNNEKLQSGCRAASYMTYDLKYKSPDWLDVTDKLIQNLAIVGTVFKKTYYSELEKRICSDLCSPKEIVVNANIKSLETAPRITHILKWYKNDVISRQRNGMFREKDKDGNDLSAFLDQYNVNTNIFDSQNNKIENNDKNKQLVFLEQCCYIDLDEDGYAEPYIVTLDYGSKKIYRICSRFANIEYSSKNKIVQIVPEKYYTDFHFLRSFDGSFYSIGFAQLLVPNNHAINSIFDLLINAGTLTTVPGGLIGSGIRLKNGEIKFQLGRYQNVSVSDGSNIGDNIYSWPTKEPSQVLFSLLGLLIQTGKDLSAVTDILPEQKSAQNVASQTVSQLIEQGSKTFIAINSRLTRSLSKEFNLIYQLNAKHLKNKEYKNIIGDPKADVKIDFNLDNIRFMPCADPSISSESQRLYKASIVQGLHGVDPIQASKYFLQSMELEEPVIQKLVPEKQPVPPDDQLKMAKAQEVQANMANLSAQATLSANKMQMEYEKMQASIKLIEAQIGYYQGMVWDMQQTQLHNLRKDQITNTKMQAQEELKAVDLARKSRMDQHMVNMDILNLDRQSKVDKHTAAMNEMNLAHNMIHTNLQFNADPNSQADSIEENQEEGENQNTLNDDIGDNSE